MKTGVLQDLSELLGPRLVTAAADLRAHGQSESWFPDYMAGKPVAGEAA